MPIFPPSAGAGNKARTWADLPPAILERLAGEAIHSPDEWRALSRAKRRSIFGITPRHIAAIDRAAAEGAL